MNKLSHTLIKGELDFQKKPQQVIFHKISNFDDHNLTIHIEIQ